jgi:ParB family chromosome partitioning protein
MSPLLASMPPDPKVLHWIAPGDLVLRPQVRSVFDPDALAGLAANIRQHGVLQPIVVYLDEGRPVVLDGERRVRASLLAEIARIPARLLLDPLDVAKVKARQLAANLQREPLNLIEQAEGFQAFITQSGFTAEQAAAELGLSPSKVCRTLTLNKLSPEHKQLVAAGKIPGESAYLLTRVDDPAARDALALQVAAGELSRDTLTAAVQRLASCTSDQGGKPASGRSAQRLGKTPVWRMTRSIGLGVALAVSGTGLTLEELVALLDAFMIRARAAIASKTPVARFLSEFRYDAAAAAKGVTQ